MNIAAERASKNGERMHIIPATACDGPFDRQQRIRNAFFRR
jgi:hypothetical protein